MAGETINSTILRTKLHRPPAPGDYVHRVRLSDYLDQQLERPLTLVSAPAGYGKSTLVSCWLDRCDSPNAWISLDENDNDLRQFLSYFIAAVKTIFPNAVSATSIWLMLRPCHPFRLCWAAWAMNWTRSSRISSWCWMIFIASRKNQCTISSTICCAIRRGLCTWC